MHEKKDTNYITQTTLIQNGWTKKMINDLLPEPKLRRNPFYNSAPAMKTWSVEIVEAVKETQEYKEALEKAEKRKASAKKAVEKKRNALLQEVEKKITEIHIEHIDEDELMLYVQQDKNEHLMERGSDGLLYFTEKTMNRWIVNYIRHNLTDYDYELYSMAGKTGCHDAYILYRNAVLTKIAEMYPKYTEECKRQMIH